MMDPNVTLRLIASARRPSLKACINACESLAAWLARGGFEPDWEACPIGARRFQAWRAAR